MVDVFGSSSRRRGKRGAVGPRGPPGEGLPDFLFGKELSKLLYDNLSFSCYFKDKKSGLIYDKEKVVAIKNQVGKNHAVAINKFENLIKIPDYGFGVEMTKSKYVVSDIEWARTVNSKSIFVFAFKIDEYPRRGFEFLFHTEFGDRAIYLKGTNLVIQACKSPQHYILIPYLQREWNKCYIEFNNCQELQSYYKINDLEGTFITERTTNPKKELIIGGKENFFFKGVLARFDCYTKFAKGDEKVQNLPIAIRNSFLREHYDIDEEETEQKKLKTISECEMLDSGNESTMM